MVYVENASSLYNVGVRFAIRNCNVLYFGQADVYFSKQSAYTAGSLPDHTPENMVRL